jgi:chemotaxis signal transduction protein
MVHLLFFSVDGVRGAIPLNESMYLVRMVMITPVEDPSHGIVGMMSVQGSSLPVYSLRRLLGFHDRPPRLNDNLIISSVGSSQVALWVDETFVVQESDDILSNSPGLSSDELVIPGVRILPDGLVLISDLTLFLQSWTYSVVPQLKSLLKSNPDVQLTDPDLETEETYPDDPLVVNRVLTERAEELARPGEKKSDTSTIEILKFRLLYHEYAVEMQYVREVVLSREITPVPGTPEHLIGICPIRGEIIPLIDLRVLLSLQEKGLTDYNQVIVLTNGIITFGILADQITGIRTIPTNQITSVNHTNIPGKADYFLGIDNRDTMVLNASVILADPTIIIDSSGESDV